jgi:TAT (twin-arginine translocation) pathway signal sequence
MSLSRRDFLKFSGTSATGVALGAGAVNLAPV